MESPLTYKRRRLNDIASKLTKPFVSPLRTVKATKEATGKDLSKSKTLQASDQQYLPSTAAHTITTFGLAVIPSDVKPLARDACDTPVRSSPLRKFAAQQKATSGEVTVQKDIADLNRQIRQVTSELDTLKQAKQISNSTTDADLEDLSAKWRATSQAIAEELFGTVKERVYRMGGVAAWREGERRKFERAHGMGDFAQDADPQDDDADCEFDSQGEELPEDEQEYRKKMKQRLKQEMIDAADVVDGGEGSDPVQEKQEKSWMEEGQEDDAFTMDMMLQSLNIPLTVIGFDKESQRWLT